MDSKSNPKISVILTAHNYAKYLSQAIDSVLNQTFNDFELIIVNDGSTDHTPEVLERYSDNIRINIVNLDGVGLAAACNAGIKVAKGQYIIRLDADDYFDENMLLIENSILDTMPHIHMVYSDYYRIDSTGTIIDHYRLMSSNDELKLLDRAPLGAGAMYRRWCYDEISGYDEKLRYQEDYDFWLKFVSRFNVYNVRLPLMYYRQHDTSMSTNKEKRMMARRHVKKKFIEGRGDAKELNIVGLVPASVFLKRGSSFKFPLVEIDGNPLIYYPISALKGCEYIKEVYIATDDQEVEDTAKKLGAESLGLKPKDISRPSVTIEDVVRYHLKEMDSEGVVIPDLIFTISPNYPFIKSHHVNEAIDTMLIHDYDSVISVVEHYDFQWTPGPFGLVPLGYNRKMIKKDHETVYVETGGIRVVKTKNLLGENWLGNSIGFIEMNSKEALAVESSEFSINIVSKMLQEGHAKDIQENEYLYSDRTDLK